MSENEKVLLSAKDLKVHFPVKQGFFESVIKKEPPASVKAVDGISFDVIKGKTLALVGESGCGKTTTGRALIGLNTPTGGEVYFDGQRIDQAGYEEMRKIRRRMQFVFQDPYSSLNPRMNVLTTLERSMLLNEVCRPEEVKEKAEELMKMVGLLPNQLYRYPHEFSGGQRQRISVARALSVNPELIIADEPTAALDVSIQCQVLNLMLDIRERLGLSMIFITHDLSVVNYMADEVAVMYLGKIVEIGGVKDVFRNPGHPYTKALLEALPRRSSVLVERKVKLKGSIPSPLNPPTGCALHPRCPYATERCSCEEPKLLDHNGVRVACHLVNE